MEPSIRLWLLGTPRAEYAGQSIRGFESRRSFALLGYLASQNAPVPRAQLATLLWPDHGDDRARGNLRVLLHNLVNHLPGCLAVDRQSVRLLGLPACWIDVAAFEELAAQNTLPSLAAAAELYRSSFLDGLYVDDCPEVETWLTQQREHWHERAAHLLTELTARAHERQEWAAGLRSVDRLLALDPWREAAHQDKMRLLALSGQRDSAMAQYEICRRVLDEELGIDPSPETTALYEHIRDHQLKPSPTPTQPRATLPMPSTPLLGRADDLAQLVVLLAQPECRLLTLLGPGGAGKTRLALAVAEARQQTQAVVFVALASLTTPEALISAIVTTLGASADTSADPRQSLLNELRQRRLLLILDNLEHLLQPNDDQPDSALALLDTIVQHAPSVQVLVTSRERVLLYEEQLYPVRGLAVPDVDAHEAGVYGAVQLFLQRARQVQPTFVLTPATTPAMIQIVRLLEGQPLAIELAAAWIGMLSVDEIATELTSNMDLLASDARNIPARHRSMRASYSLSWKRLQPAQQAVQQALSVFRGGFTRAAAAAITGAQPQTLQQLTDQSLVASTMEANGGVRYHLHELLRQFAAEHFADDSAVEQRIRTRHAEYYLRLAEEAAPELAYGSAQAAWFAQVSTELDNIRTALRWAADQGAARTVLRFGVALREFWMTRAYLREGRQWLETGLALADRRASDVDPQLRNRALATAGWLAANSRDFATAERLLEASLVLARSSADTRQMIATLGDLGQATRMRGDLKRATALYQEALAFSRTLGDQRGVAWTLCNLGIIAHAHEHDHETTRLLEECVAVSQQVGDRICTAWCLTFLARVAKDQAQYKRSATRFAEALTIFHEVEHADAIAFTLEGCAGLAVACADLRRAARLFGAAEALRERIQRVQPLYERDVVRDQRIIASDGWHADWMRGRAMSQAEALELGYAVASTTS